MVHDNPVASVWFIPKLSGGSNLPVTCTSGKGINSIMEFLIFFYQRALEPRQRFSHVCVQVITCVCPYVPVHLCFSFPLLNAAPNLEDFSPRHHWQQQPRLQSSCPAQQQQQGCYLSLALITVWKVTTQSRGLLSSAPLSSVMHVWGQQVWQIWSRALLIWQNRGWTNY